VSQQSSVERAVSFLKEAGRPVSAREFAEAGFNRMTLLRAVQSGLVERSARGVYRLIAPGEDSRALWAGIAYAMPEAVFCMESAAAYHGLTQNMAGVLNIALPAGSRIPAPGSTGVAARYMTWRRPEAFTLGVETLAIEGVTVRITDPARTVVDLFRYSTLVPQRSEPSIMTDPETVHDALVRYLHGEAGGSAAELARMARAFGAWERLKPNVEMLNLSWSRGPSA